MLKPVCAEQPTGSTITGVNLVEREEKEFMFSTKVKKLTFQIQLTLPREALLRLQRTFEDFSIFRNGLRDENALQTEKPFPDYGNEELTGSDVEVDLLLELMEDLDEWLRRCLSTAQIEKSSALRSFLECTEADCKKMDMDLSAMGGLDGAWSVDYD